jgi:hypothetical protein
MQPGSTTVKGLLFNTLVGLGLGRFSKVGRLLIVFPPLVAAELAYGVFMYHLNMPACVRRGAALLICGELAFLLGALMRPIRGEIKAARKR